MLRQTLHTRFQEQSDEQKNALKKNKGNSTKTQRNTPKLRTDEIQLATNQSPKNHYLGSIQTLGKTDRSKEEKWGKTEKLSGRKSQRLN